MGEVCRWGKEERHSLIRYRVRELQIGGVELQRSVGQATRSVNLISDDWIPRRHEVNSDLVRTPGTEPRCHKRAISQELKPLDVG